MPYLEVRATGGQLEFIQPVIGRRQGDTLRSGQFITEPHRETTFHFYIHTHFRVSI